VNFATSKRPAFSLYPSFLETPEWMPQGDTVSLDVAGISANDEEGPLYVYLAIVLPLHQFSFLNFLIMNYTLIMIEFGLWMGMK
jgi:hypothetical protein